MPETNSRRVSDKLQRLENHILHRFGAPPTDAGAWRVVDAYEGTQVFGGTGSGKTSGSGRTLAKAFLEAGFGGLVLVAKDDEAENWERYCADAKRAQHLLVLRPGGSLALNLLDYEFRRGGGLTHNLVSLFMTALGSGGGEQSKEPYWEDALRQLLTNAIDLVSMGLGRVRLDEVVRLVQAAPQSAAEASSDAWLARSFCAELLHLAMQRVTDGPRRLDLEATAAYWLVEFAGLADRVRSIIVSSFLAKATGLLRSPSRELFCGETTVTPEDTFRGRILVLDVSVKRYGELGRFAQVLLKTVWQRAAEGPTRNLASEDTRPVFLWADESQYFVTAEDALFQTTARSKMVATVYLTQSLANYHMVMGRQARAATSSFLGNLVTKVFHANGDPETNKWAETVIGDRLGELGSRTLNLTNEPGLSTGDTEAWLPSVRAVEFTRLKKGGLANDRVVEAIVFQAGRSWGGRSNFTRTQFHQT